MTVQINGTTGVSLVQDSTITSAKIVDGSIDQVDMTLAATSIGVGQTWQTVTRVSGTPYTNTTGKPIEFRLYWVSGSSTLVVTVDGYAHPTLANMSSAQSGMLMFSCIIPPTKTYTYTSTVSFTAVELR